MYKKLLTSIMALTLIIGVPTISFAHENCNQNHGYAKECQKGSKVKKALKYAAFGAGAGYVLSGKKNRGTNMVKGAAIGTAASFFVGK